MEAGLFAKILEPALRRDNSAEDDLFNEEGFCVCAHCNEPKEAWFEVKGLIPKCVRPRMCKCERDKREAEEAERKRKERQLRIERYRHTCLADEQYKECTFTADDGADPEASGRCRKYVEKWDKMAENNIGLLLWGDVGGGKTFLAGCIANALIDMDIPATMTTIPKLVAAMTKDFGAERGNVLHMVANAPLLVLDDVGTERNTEYSNEQVYEIINTRYKAKKPLIITTNLTMKAMKETDDVTKKRIYDRLVEMCTPCKVTSTGRRQQAARSKMELMMQLFESEE
ncbi:MAG: ATP-binding protein [Oscillospiraceae bacterium]|nr:ATP-binding protein [Oscillospiraceae bacterium]